MQGSVGNQTTTTASSAATTNPNPTTTPQPQQQQPQQQSAKNQSNSNSHHQYHHSNSNGGAPPPPRQHTVINVDVPVRILVPSESVGAIIGKGGQTIRQLTQQSRAKVDVYRGEMMTPSNALQEKVITIRGQPDNCVNACREILKVMKADSESKGQTGVKEMPLKVLAHNDYIGRIIGKQGDIINSIKRDTDTTVTVSSANDININVERVITIKGELENMIKALAIIHAKIRSAFENDSKTYGHQAMVMSTIPQMPMLAPPYHHHLPAASGHIYNGGGGAMLPPSSNPAIAGGGHYSKAQVPNGTNYTAGTGSANGQLMGPAAANSQPGAGAANANYASAYYPPPHLIHHMGAAQPAGSHSHAQGYGPATMYGHVSGGSGGAHMAAGYSNNGPHVSHGYMPPHQPIQNEYGPPMPGHGGSGYPESEKVFLYIPNTAVGAIIGSKGSYIKNLIKLSGASIKIAPVPAELGEEARNVSERQVIISGLPDSQCKAQFYIYDKIRQERFTTDDNVKLRAEIPVPAGKIGRIIGRAGKNVRDIQRTTGATIKLPDETVQSHQKRSRPEAQPEAASNDATVQEKSATVTEEAAAEPEVASKDTTDASASEEKGADASEVTEANEFVMVGIIGTFNSSQLAQRRIQALVNSTSMRLEAAAPQAHHHMVPPTGAYHHHHPAEGKGHFYPKSNGFAGGRRGRGGHQAGSLRSKANKAAEPEDGPVQSAAPESPAGEPEQSAVTA